MSTMTPKIVMFRMDINDPTNLGLDSDDPSHNNIEVMIRELSNALTGELVTKSPLKYSSNYLF